MYVFSDKLLESKLHWSLRAKVIEQKSKMPCFITGPKNKMIIQFYKPDTTLGSSLLNEKNKSCIVKAVSWKRERLAQLETSFPKVMSILKHQSLELHHVMYQNKARIVLLLIRIKRYSFELKKLLIYLPTISWNDFFSGCNKLHSIYMTWHDMVTTSRRKGEIENTFWHYSTNRGGRTDGRNVGWTEKPLFK